jgi:cystathionine beta-lyase
MANVDSLNRRTFIKSAGVAALAGAANTLKAAPQDTAADTTRHAAPVNGRYDFDKVYDRVGSNCSRWDSPPRRYPDGQFQYGMGVASMDFECAPCITEALQERVQHHSWGYMSSTDSLREAIVEWAGERHQVDLGIDELALSDGVYPGLVAALRSFVPAHGKVLLNTPVYSGFYTIARRANVQTVDSLMRYVNGRFEPDWEDLERKMTPDVRAMIVCNPQNPTGNVWTEDELLRIGRLCLDHDIVMLSDEIHCDVIRDGYAFTPVANLPDQAVVNNSLTFTAISKTFNLAGMKNAHYYSKNPTLLERVNQYHAAELSTLGVVATEAAYRHGADWFEQANAYMDNTHTLIERFISEQMPSVGYTRNEGTYMTFLDFSKVLDAIDAREQAAIHGKESPEHYFQDWLVHKSGVYLNPGSNYGLGGEGHMRMNIASSQLVIQEVLEAMASALRTV